MATKYQRVGLHVSAAGGVEKAPERAAEFGAEVFQFFSRSPRGGGAPEISDEQTTLFKARMKEYGLVESYIHTPYYVNFASKNKRIYHGSIAVVREELERGSKLGVKYVMTHMGSSRDYLPSEKRTTASGRGPARGGKAKSEKQQLKTPHAAMKHAIAGLKKVFVGNPNFSTKLLLEISAGAGAVLGDRFEELAALLKGLSRRDVYVCLDTCHLFASGYDVRTKAALDDTMKQFKKHLGMSRLKLVHVNDSKAGLGEHKDRHEHIGKGKIGAAGFKALLAHPAFQKTNFILETKHDAGIGPDLAFLKKWRSVKRKAKSAK